MDEYDDEDGPAFPLTVTVAGWLWAVYGVTWAATGLLFGYAAARGGGSIDVITAALFSGLAPGVFMACAGYKAVRGTETDCFLPALVSLLVGLIVTGVAIALVLTLPAPHAAPVAMVGTSAVLLLASGLFGFYGRGAYLRWRESQGERRSRL